MATGPLSKEELESLKLEQDFTGEDAQTLAKRAFQETAPAAARAICRMAVHSDSDRIRLQAAQYVTERVLGRIQDDPPKATKDPFAELFKEVAENLERESTTDA